MPPILNGPSQHVLHRMFCMNNIDISVQINPLNAIANSRPFGAVIAHMLTRPEQIFYHPLHKRDGGKQHPKKAT